MIENGNLREGLKIFFNSKDRDNQNENDTFKQRLYDILCCHYFLIHYQTDFHNKINNLKKKYLSCFCITII